MLLQTAVSAASQVHPLSGTIAEWVWLLPILPLAGFVINGLLSFAGGRIRQPSVTVTLTAAAARQGIPI